MEKSLDDWAMDLRAAKAAERAAQAELDRAQLAHHNAAEWSQWIGQSIMRIANGRAPLPGPAPAETIYG